MSRRLLVVDDEDTLCEALRFNLEAEGYEVDTVHSAEEALSVDLSVYDLILLDIMMEEISGTQFARILKSNTATASIPIIFCTARDAEDDMVEGLELGADDYITKPFSMRNVLARVKTVLRRTSGREVENTIVNMITFEGLAVETVGKKCLVDGREVQLPKKEFEILQKLLGNIGRVFTREELLREIWPDDVTVVDRVVDVNIARIRHKIGQYGKFIKSRSGYGYGFLV